MNKRYAARYDARLDALIGERLMREGKPRVEVIAHTPRACAVRWLDYDDVMHRAWLWRGQVHPRGSRRTRQGS